MNIVVRKALASDVGALVNLSRRTINASYRTFLGDVAVDAFLGSGAADRYVEENIGQCSVILRDGAVAGYAVCCDNVLDLMMIDCAAHRQGLGTRLITHVETMLFSIYSELVLESFADNQIANTFYRMRGWIEVGERFDTASGVSKIVFRKTG
jgi:ribosomal protein S18 acetylase RimI-like enzyme